MADSGRLTAPLPGMPRWVGHVAFGRPTRRGPHEVVVPVHAVLHRRRLILWALLTGKVRLGRSIAT